MKVEELLDNIEAGNDVQKSASILGILIEQKISGRSADGNIADQVILGKAWAGLRLSDEELHDVVDRLLKYLDEAAVPHPMAVWALTKSPDPRLLDYLVRLIDRFIADPDQEHLVYQALVGIIPFYNQQPLKAIRRAAESGSGLVKETASHYLELHDLK